jgi:hypothetical protein
MTSKIQTMFIASFRVVSAVRCAHTSSPSLSDKRVSSDKGEELSLVSLGALPLGLYRLSG